jgi:hypothetical protein
VKVLVWSVVANQKSIDPLFRSKFPKAVPAAAFTEKGAVKAGAPGKKMDSTLDWLVFENRSPVSIIFP